MSTSFSDFDGQLYLNRKEVARILKMSHRTLANWASVGKGPKFVKLERKVCYPVADLKEYLHQHGLL
ncbi:TPA: helix-turn-helix domain-containing protein [Vibrio parahaemolyticus]|nr:helix-turn-helix domain-containing protein [Vibrio parahaemolyticus]